MGMMVILAPGPCWPCIGGGLASLLAAGGIVRALQSPLSRAEAGKRIVRVVHAKLGACRECIVLSFLLLAVSLWALAAGLRSHYDLRAIAALSLATGALLSLSVAHVLMLFWRRAVAKAGGRPPLALGAARKGRCCGR